MKQKHIPFFTLLFSLPAVGIFLFPAAAGLLQYQRPAIIQGEFWRLFTQHWTHWNADHLFWDLATFVGLGIACEGRDRTGFLRVTVVSGLLISLSLFVIQPGLMICRGLSGIDSALFGFLITDLFLGHRRTNQPVKYVCFFAGAAFFVKTVIEIHTGATVFVNSQTNLMVPVPIAHLAGFLTGRLLATPASVAIFGFFRGSRRPSHELHA